MLPMVMENFLLYLEGENKNSKTISSYRVNLKSFLNGVFDGKDPKNEDYNKLTVNDLMNWINDLRIKDHLSASTLNQRIATIKKFYTYLAGLRLVSTNVAQGVGTIKSNELFQRAILTEEEVITLVSTAKDMIKEELKGYTKYSAYRDEMIVNLFLCTGLRIEELSNIDLNDINFDTRELKVLGKRGKRRVVIIPKSKMNMLYKYLEVRATVKGSQVDDALFLSRQRSENGYRLGTDQIRIVVVKMAKKAGVKSITPHSLRHTGATLQIKKGADIMDVSKWLGHSTVAITEKIYVHQTNESACRVADVFDGMF